MVDSTLLLQVIVEGAVEVEIYMKLTEFLCLLGCVLPLIGCGKSGPDDEAGLGSVIETRASCIVDETASVALSSENTKTILKYQALGDSLEVNNELFEQIKNSLSMRNLSSIDGSTLELQGVLPGSCVTSDAYVDKATILNPSSGSPSACTAAVVGPRTLILAAHCLGDTTSAISIKVHPSEPKAEGTCIAHPDYVPGTKENDLALCRLNKSISIAQISNNFQTVSIVDSTINESTVLGFAGFGCTSTDATPSDLGSGIALATKQRDALEICHKLPKTLVTSSTFSDPKRICTDTEKPLDKELSIVTNVYCNGRSAYSYVCSGDSGGPLFQASRGDLTDFNQKKSIIGVTSQSCRGSLKCKSYINRLSVFADIRKQKMSGFIETWANTCSQICGVGRPAHEAADLRCS